jgi:hypothetical protein
LQVEKSLQRINRGYKNAMYTSQKSIENKVGGGGSIDGWKDLLMAVGFRFEPAANGIPAAVFFPQSDPGERLTQASASLQALLGLSPTSWAALAKLLTIAPEAADEILALVRQAVSQFAVTATASSNQHVAGGEAGLLLPVSVRLWRLPGCHELLASLGFDLMEVGRDEVTLRTGKSANRRQIQFALTALIALFDTDEAPRSLDDVIDSSSDSMEDYGNVDGNNLRHGAASPPASMILPPPPPPPFPAPRKSDVILDGSSGSAFSSYARNRGEPDGRQAQGDSPTNTGGPSSGFQNVTAGLIMPSMVYQNSGGGLYSHQKGGRESDCNFTPSPVESWRGSGGAGRYISQYGAASGSPGSLDPISGSSPLLHHSNAYSPGSGGKFAASRFGKLGPSPLSRPESSSSAASGSGQDWEAAAATVVRRAGGSVGNNNHHHHYHHHHHHNQLNNKLSPSVTSTVDATATAAGFRKYLQSANNNSGLYDSVSDDMSSHYSSNNSSSQIIPPVRSIFTETGYHSRLLSEAVSATAASQNDRLSIRAEIGTSSGSQLKFAARRKDNARLEPGVTTRVPPTGESNSPKGTLTNSKAGTAAPAETNSTSACSQYNSSSAAAILEVVSGTTSSSGVMMRNADNLGTEASAIKEHIMASQMRRLNRELPISEVYHERNIGLGLAPTLSKLILSNSIAVAQVDHHPEPSNSSVASSSEAASSSASSPHLNLTSAATANSMDNSLNSFDNLSAIEEVHHHPHHHHRHPLKTASRSALNKRPPIPAPKPRPESAWMGAGLIQTTMENNGLMAALLPPAPPSLSPSGTRDDGDGRSMTDSQYSGCSPSATTTSATSATALKDNPLLPRFSYMSINGGGTNGDMIKTNRPMTTALHLPTEEEEEEVQVFTDVPAATIINPTNVRPSDVAQYINSEFHSRNKAHSSSSSSTKHPQLWVKDKNGRFTYNGNFSSDC